MAFTGNTRLVSYDWTYTSHGGERITMLVVYGIENNFTNGTAEELLAEAIERGKNNPRIMTFDEFDERDRKLTLSHPVREVTEETFHEMLNVLPPLKWVDRTCEKRNCAVNEFCMSEFDHGPFTSQYARAFVDGETKYFSATVDYYDESTWIHNRL